MHYQELPKTIWFLWLQGLSEAPLVVRRCYASWVKHNPDWNIIFLDEENLGNYISTDTTQVITQSRSDIIRINLLAKYGGVWVDATCFCTKPLDEWLNDYMPSGFFAFAKPAPDRMISTWFIAGNKDNHIIQAYQQAVQAYWKGNPGITFIETSRWHFLSRCLARFGPRVWFGRVATRILKIYPYFWFHYLFGNLYLKDNEFKRLWDSTPKISADIPHQLQFAGLLSPLNEKIKEVIDKNAAPVYKLMWKSNASDYKEGTVLAYLLDTEL